MVDFGCSHGRNSMACVKSALDGIPTDLGCQISVHLNDLPDNDFQEVEKCLKDPQLSYNFHTILSNPKTNITTHFNKGSFYQPCLPESSIHLAFTLQSLHWLESPIPLSSSIFSNSSFLTPEESLLMSNIAQNEFITFLQLRAKELKPKGRLLITMLKDSSHIESICQGWLNYLKANNFSQSDFKSVNIPAYKRSNKDVQRALDQVKDLYTPILVTNHTDGKIGVSVDTLRTTTYNVLMQGIRLHSPFSSTSEMESFLDGFYASLIPNWPQLQQQFHLIILERSSSN